MKGFYQKAHLDWLQLRYPLDETARNRHLESQALSYLVERHDLQVLDLGAGAGANVCYYSRLLPSSTQWSLVERDAALLQQFPQLNDCPREGKYNSVMGDFLDPHCPIYKRSFDLVLANAVFDLLSANQFQGLLRLFRQAWGENSPLFLFTINLDQGTLFYPVDRETERWCQSYEEHMQRPQYFGQAMAAHCADRMGKLFLENGFKVESAPSPWEVSPMQREILLAKLDFFEKSITQLIGMNTWQRNLFQRWLEKKRYQACNQELSLSVPHRDFLARML